MELLRALGEGLLELVYPTRCAGCDLPGRLLCEECHEAVARAAGIEPPLTGLDSVRCVGSLERPLSRIVTVYKDGNERRLAAPLGALLAERIGDRLCRSQAITWVPATRTALARRGFDHAERLAAQVGETASLPTRRLLEPVRARDQRGLGRQERARNVIGAFAIAPAATVPQRVVLVDDVLTTGATLQSAASVLRSAGAAEVHALTLAMKL